MPTLEILSGKHSGQTFTFTTEAKIGKDDTCQIKLSDPGVSRYHAQIRVAGGQMSIEDLGSSNGTYVNFKKRSKGENSQLADRDIIFFGRTVSKFWLEAPPDADTVSLELLRSTAPVQGTPNQAQLETAIREAEQVEVIRRLRLHELNPQQLQALFAKTR